ncbi:MAG: EAL domain-containing protein [Gammaproteobacteria bacterium]|nr:MAG: EAL domain-containing protein [Gammaproteobacteria bacterium]
MPATSIVRHIAKGSIFIHLVLLPLFVLAVTLFAQHKITDQFFDEAKHHAKLIAKRIELSWPEKKAISHMLDREVALTNIVYVYIANSQGKILAQSSFIPSHRHFQEDSFFDQHQDGIFDISIPMSIRDQDSLPTRLYVGFNEERTKRAIQNLRLNLTLFTLIYILIALAITLASARKISSPLNKLRVAIQKSSNTLPDDEIHTSSNLHEIRALAQEINIMRKDLVSQAQKLRHQATHDILTGLPNRALCMDRISQAMALCQRKRKHFVLMLLDLDQFKEINDTLGHKAGDTLLEVTASRLIRIVRKSDSVARLGGDEFAILLPTADASQAAIVAQKALKSIQKPFHFEDHTLHIHASIGAAMYPEHGKTVGELLHSADVAMYHAKRGGHGFIMHHRNLSSGAAGSLALVSDLEAAIEQEEVIPYFQPKLDIRSQTITGVEVLIRWRHHKRGLLFPDDFIPAAENSNIINRLTLYVIKKAIQQSVEWLRGGLEVSVAVNISAKNLQQPNFAATVLSLLEKHTLPSRLLEIELTESAVLNDPELAKQTLSRLSQQNVHISLDDFGAGNTSLAHFLELPLDTIKIDKSFVRDIFRNPNQQSIVHRIIELAHALNLSTTVEGVEDEKALQLLTQLDADAIQGYVLCKPLMAREFEMWVKQQGIYQIRSGAGTASLQ